MNKQIELLLLQNQLKFRFNPKNKKQDFTRLTKVKVMSSMKTIHSI